MDKKLEQLIRNLHVIIHDRLNQQNFSTIDDLFDDLIVNVNIEAFYKDFTDKEINIDFSKDDLISNLKGLFKKAKPTKAVAESSELETWLDSAKRINEETRFECYKKILIEDNKGSIVEQLEADTYKILDSCHDPRILSRRWDRRGLVYGHVQSGKTANYVGLINRAFDAGYRIVIVLTGMNEDLRSQTQARIDSGVIGKSEGIPIGIGKKIKFQELEDIIPATSIKLDLKNKDDWRKNTIDIKKKSIWVIKKNKTVLENLIFWLDLQRRNQESKSEKINGVPFLIIDDEADNASIQSLSKNDYELWETGIDISNIDLEELTEEQEEKLNKAKEAIIKAINRNIRVALSLIGHKTFVAYTATPYSVISGKSESLGIDVPIRDKIFKIDKDNDLFPEHFIIPIKPGNKYLGIERIFTTNPEKKLPLVIDVNSSPYYDQIETIYPTKKGVNYSFEDIPKSLEDAIIHFFITVIVRKFRGQKDYNTLLIHTSHLTKNADYVADKVDKFIIKLCNNITINQGDYIEHFNEVLLKVKITSSNKLFIEYFGVQEYKFPDRITKEDILNVINDELSPLDVVSYHSSNDVSLKHQNHSLNYNLKDTETGEKLFRNYIVIGGNRLSRGLTLEGLTTSYFVRSSTRQDSLYQMGRWFGYRIGYEDLVRIFMPKDQILWFEGVYRLEMDLRKNFEDNNSEDSKIMPRDAIIKLAYHTDENMYLSDEVRKKYPTICDPNKLRNTKIEKISFSGPTKTNKIIYDKQVQLRNLNKVKELISDISKDEQACLYDNSKIPEIVKNNNINFEKVKYTYITSLLEEYEVPDELQVDIDSLSDFIFKNKKELDFWSVVLAQKPGSAIALESIDWQMEFYNKDNILLKQSITGVQRKWEDIPLSTPTVKYISQFLDRGSKDNSFDIINRENINEFELNHAQAAKKYRNQQVKPLLIIYPVVYETYVFPLLYFIIPEIKGGEKVVYLVRRNRNN